MIAKGYPANVMPANFAQTLTPKELEDLVQYLLESTGSGGKGGGSKNQGRLNACRGRAAAGIIRWRSCATASASPRSSTPR